MSNFNPQEINNLIASRRSVYPKMYSEEKVEDEVIQRMLENANWAPTHKFTEPWRFKVFTGEGLKRLADFQAERYRIRSGENFDEKRYQKQKSSPLKASHVIAIGMKRNDIIPEIEEIMSVACAVQNMALTATAYGVGSYWSTGGTTFDEEAKGFFDLEEDDKLLGFLFVGKSEFVGMKGQRQPIDNKVTWVR